MTLGVLLAVLAAAFLPALWNALIKVGSDKVAAMVGLSVMEVPIGLAVGLTRPWPPAEVWPYVIAAGCAHFGYKFFLSSAYQRGDLSRVYPLARGAAPLIVAVVSWLALSDLMTTGEVVGVAVLGLGIILMARGVFVGGEERRLVPLALGSAAATATYTLIDGLGARVSGDAVAYVAWVFVADGTFFTLGMLAWKGRQVLPPVGRRVWSVAAIAAAASYGAYPVSVWAMTVAPIALVAALRETSNPFAVLIGWLVFGERMDSGKGITALTIVAGIVVARF
jgi:drug/metabolite transporter (DMT)-like permease